MDTQTDDLRRSDHESEPEDASANEVDNQEDATNEVDNHEGASENESDNVESASADNAEKGKAKDVKSKYKTGVVYLSKIPPGRNYTRIREIFEKFAPIGNIYLVPDKQANSKLQKKGKVYKCYKEGFVEFKRKKDAKNFTSIFNGAALQNSTDGFIWDIRYLHR